MTSNTSKPMTEREAGRVALKELLKPISVRLLVGRTLAALGGVLAIAPYIALVKLGAVFYQAYSTGTEVDTVLWPGSEADGSKYRSMKALLSGVAPGRA